MVVAPILAIMSYFATDYIVSEKPHIAKDGSIYKMRINSNCRWKSGKCSIDNADIKIDIIGQWLEHSLVLNLSSNILLNSVKVSFDKNDIAKDMIIDKKNNLKWGISLDKKNKSTMLNFAIVVNRSVFLAQISTIFLVPEKNENF